MMFPLVRDLAADNIPVAVTCRVLGFSKQAFYKWNANPVTQRDWDDAHLIHAAMEIHHDDPAFGYRFIRDELAEQGIVASRNRVNRLCTVGRLWSVHSRKRGLNRKPGPPVHDDLVLRDFTATAPNELWLTDITEHPTAEGKLYLCAIKDACSRRIVGYSIDSRMTAALAVNALRNALALRGHVEAIVHSDRGSQGGLNRPSQHLEREVQRWHTATGRSRYGSIGGRSPRQGVRPWRGERIACGSGQRSVRARRPTRPRSRPACRRRSATAGFATLAA
jgi:transposase InsO family protein